MIRSSCFDRLRTVAILHTAAAAVFFYVLLMPGFRPFDIIPRAGEVVTVYMDGVEIGTLNAGIDTMELYREARREFSSEHGKLVFSEMPEFEFVKKAAFFCHTDSEKEVTAKIKSRLESGIRDDLAPSYSIKVNGTVVTVKSAEEAGGVLKSAIERYDRDDAFDIELVKDSSREFNVLIPKIVDKKNSDADLSAPLAAGAGHIEEDLSVCEFKNSGEGFDSFDYCVNDIAFSDDVEIVESYLAAGEAADPELASSMLFDLQEVQQIYTVQKGDTLSEIALTVGLPLDEIIALNDSLENENSVIHPDEELIITVPEPELSVVWKETERVEEIYDLPTEYIYNDSWYTNHSEVITQPSAGCRDAVIMTTRMDDKEISREVLYEEIKAPAVAKVVEVGTIIPPTFIKPISGGRMSSPFGRRKKPKAGASSFHKGIDWATPVGTSVYASSGGTVVKAGWGSGYGYVVYINHPNGMQTRYGHLSKVYAKVGQTVKQGEVIAASGNTGVSTGPHIHFEILVGGTQVDPMNYL